jgi:predicted RNA-binding Zn-ribbon protein involved in translation (DUF1610 family)
MAKHQLICAECGAAMNLHAVKVVYDGPSSADPDLGGTLVEWHACPKCGAAATRPEEQSD